MKKTFCFDIDGIIMTLTPKNDYNLSEPIIDTVVLVNKLYDMGHQIILNTARGYVTDIDWEELTKNQLSKCGLKYHKLIFNKPAADFYIDDKMITLNELKLQLNQNKL